MNLLRRLTVPVQAPRDFPHPFSATPHPLAQCAAQDLQQRLTSGGGRALHPFMAADSGKMLGVLVVRDGDHGIGYLSAFSGMLGGHWQVPGFVPPIFAVEARDVILSQAQTELDALTQQIKAVEQSREHQSFLSALETLQRQAEQEQLRLQEQHQRQREQRRQRRSTANQLTAQQRASVLHELSYASQHDRQQRRDSARHWCARIDTVRQRLMSFDEQIGELRRCRARLSQRLQRRLFADYHLRDGQGQTRSLLEFFDQTLPPSGTGDCAGPKLLQYAHEKGLQPLAMAEFWWGSAPATGVRHHGQFYPACRGKCGPILPYMLSGLDVAVTALDTQTIDINEPKVVYEDDDLLVVNKPAGLLSVPGKQIHDSVLTRMRQRYPDADGPLLVHRLDMSTSGLLLVAKTAAVHKALQKQFIRRQIEKRYVAVLDTTTSPVPAEQGTIELPIRVDLDDRPRQCVCYDHGKAAKTDWRIIRRNKGQVRVYFYPLTGRTHQLRLHAAHRDGLAAPIVGDELYGRQHGRLLLHAERLRFFHPRKRQRLEVSVPAPF
jgi:tRNA pseudouridine32 synthase/23S rRNA pseudouridine746 synthase